jgi:HK97 family phage major capsid protein
MKFKVNDKGELVMTEEEFTTAVKQVAVESAKATATELIDAAKLNQPGAPGPIQPLPAADLEKQFEEPANETDPAKRKRLAKAVESVRGGHLALEKAPKQIKLVRAIKAGWDGDMVTVKALTEGTAEDGGNLVPVEFATDLLVAIEEYGTVRRDAMVIPMTTNEKDLRTVTTKPTISRKGELVASDEAGTKFGKPVLTVDMYTGHQIISREELDDNNVGLYDKLLDLFAEQFVKAEDTEGLVGTYYPGVLKSVTPKTITLDSVSIAEIKYKKLLALKNSLTRGQLMRGGKFYLHRTIFGLIEGIEDQNGRPITTSAFGPMGPTLFGYPVELNEVMPSQDEDAADTGFIIFGNLKWVAFGDRKGITSQPVKEATMNKAGGGTVNLASQRAVALALDIRWGIDVTIPSNLAILKTKA